MNLNRRVIISGVLLIAAGVYRVVVVKDTKTTLTRVIVGGYLLMVLASLIDLVGGPVGQISGLLLTLALGTLALAILPDIATRIAGRAATA